MNELAVAEEGEERGRQSVWDSEKRWRTRVRGKRKKEMGRGKGAS